MERGQASHFVLMSADTVITELDANRRKDKELTDICKSITGASENQAQAVLIHLDLWRDRAYPPVKTQAGQGTRRMSDRQASTAPDASTDRPAEAHPADISTSTKAPFS
jgi:hypothetical protein